MNKTIPLLCFALLLSGCMISATNPAGKTSSQYAFADAPKASEQPVREEPKPTLAKESYIDSLQPRQDKQRIYDGLPRADLMELLRNKDAEIDSLKLEIIRIKKSQIPTLYSPGKTAWRIDMNGKYVTTLDLKRSGDNMIARMDISVTVEDGIKILAFAATPLTQSEVFPDVTLSADRHSASCVYKTFSPFDMRLELITDAKPNALRLRLSPAAKKNYLIKIK